MVIRCPPHSSGNMNMLLQQTGLSQPDAPAMGRALPPQQDTRERELLAQGPPWRAGGPATLRVLILTLLWRGSLSQKPGFTLKVPQSVSVQEGLCVLIPCTFTYPASYDTDNSGDDNRWARLYGYWYKDRANESQDPPVASSDPSRGVSQETQGRFRLAGELVHGDCSLLISEAQWRDTGRYYFRFKKGTLRYSYLSSTDGTDPKLTISVPHPPGPPNITGTLTRNGRPDSPRPGTGLNSSCQRQGPSISCSCSLRSQPPPQLQWQVDGEPLAGNSSRGALQVSSWAQGDEAVSTLSWTGSGDRGPRIFCLGSNPHGSYAALYFDFSPPQRGAEEPGKLLGLGVACGLGVAVGFFLLGVCVIKLRGREPAPPRAEPGEAANGSQAELMVDDASLIYSNILTIPMDHKTPAARRTKGIQDGPAAAQALLGPGEPEELHYAAIDFSKLQRKGGEPPEAPDMEYSEVRLK
ncbi:myeloid cell surface antigen CD33-like [Mauremys mutica]|uniref:myeloid cell surface antigen CD33-like n=1 Tax=Mauremys mutica TaxID=74926 RepID=UPI001D16BF1D|nr:myeloid cell surface antigen CD33-like [Mauremys mutica]